ncbi:MAG TPA: cyclic peptide export ABC transporter, partial [Isosphaeraceae bacterium]
MSLLTFLLRSSRGVVAVAVAAGAVSGLCGVALLALIHAALGGAGPPDGRLALAFAGLVVVTVATRVVAQAATVRIGQGAVTRLGLLIGRRILALPLEQFEATDRAGLLAALTEDVALVAGALEGVPLVAINLPIVLACGAYLGWLSPAVLACAVACAAAAFVAYAALAGRAVRRLRAARAGHDALVGHFRAVIEGFRELKQHRGRREAFLAEALGPAAAAVRDRTTAGLTLFALAEGWSELAFFGVLGSLLFLLPQWRDLDRATLAGAVLVVLYIMVPLDVLVRWLPILGRARASLQKIHDLIPTLEARGPEEPPAPPLPFRAAIRLEGVAYAYRPEPDGYGFALGPLDLELRRGELVFLAGGNGSGKTTLVKLLAGLYAPTAGSILLDGRPVGAGQREAYRQLVSVVFADGYLFGELLGLGAPGLEARARAGLDRLGLGDRVAVRDGAFST